MPNENSSPTIEPVAEQSRFSPWSLVVALGCLGGLAICAFLGVVYLLRPAYSAAADRGLQTRKMPDGTRLTLEKVTFGTTHEFEFQKDDRRGPAWFSGGSVYKRRLMESTSKPMIKCWLTRRDANGAPLDFDWWSHNVAVDDLGNEFEDDNAGRISLGRHGQSSFGGSRPFSAVSPGNHDLIVVHSAVRPFRHAGHSFKLRVFDIHGSQVAEFDVPSPVSGPFADWGPDPIPTTKSDGDLAVTLTALNPETHERDESGRKRKALRLSPRFEVRQGDKPVLQWRARRIMLSDVLGNTSDNWDVRLSPREAAWKMSVHFARNEQAAFSPDERTSFGPFPIPGKDETQVVGTKQTLQGVSLELLAIGGAGKLTYVDQSPGTSNGSWHNGFWLDGVHGTFVTETEHGKFKATVESPVPHVLFRVTHSSGDIDLTLRAHDDRERPIETQPAHNGEMQLWALKTADDAKSFTVTVTVQKMRSVEFLIAPPKSE